MTGGKAKARRRILFVAEAVTLAHVARPIALARALDPDAFEVHFAVDPRYARIAGNLPFRLHALNSIPSASFLDALAKGRPLYDVGTLRTYVQADIRLLKEVMPDLVVGDFRLSLAASARYSEVPYATITNAYWSPYARQAYPVPELRLTRVLGVRLAQMIFSAARPLAFALHARPLNIVRRECGLEGYGLDLRRTYTDADWTLYADVPGMTPMSELPGNHLYLGPILWAPEVDRPRWWNDIGNERPVVYVTPGSSGAPNLLRTVLQALASLPVTVIAASAGQQLAGDIPKNAYIADYLPGIEAASRAALVICNGGSLTTQQALAAGTPVLGIPMNLDQHLNMSGVTGAGAGMVLRSGLLREASIRDCVVELLDTTGFAEAARIIASTCNEFPAPARFAKLVNEIVPAVG